MDMKKAKKLFAAQQKLRACTLEHCAQEEAFAMKKNINSKIQAMTLDVSSGAITRKEYFDKLNKIFDKLLKDSAARNSVECNAKFCHKDMMAALEMMTSNFGIKVDFSKVKTAKDYINMTRNVTIQMMNNLLDKMPPRQLKKK
jgi:hypothetical protein